MPAVSSAATPFSTLPISWKTLSLQATKTMKLRLRPQRIIPAVFLSIAVLMLAIAAFTAVRSGLALGKEIAAPGYVVDLVVRMDETGSDYYTPVVAFTLPDGSRRTVQVAEGSRTPAYQQDQPVTVAYDPDDPGNVRIVSVTSSLSMWIVPLVTGVLAAAFLAATLFARRVIGSRSDA
jgi:hypothetical protein